MSTIQKVGSVLRKAGFTTSRSMRSKQIRGWVTRSTGFAATKSYASDAFCTVKHYEDRTIPAGERDAFFAGKIAEYNTALTAAGLSTRIENRQIVVLK